MAVNLKRFQNVVHGAPHDQFGRAKAVIAEYDLEPDFESEMLEEVVAIDSACIEERALDACECLEAYFASAMIPRAVCAKFCREAYALLSLRMAAGEFFCNGADGLVTRSVKLELPVDTSRYSEVFLEMLIRTRFCAMGVDEDSQYQILDWLAVILNFKLLSFGRSDLIWPEVDLRYFTRRRIAPHLRQFRKCRAQYRELREAGEGDEDASSEAHFLAHRLLALEGVVNFHSEHIRSRNMSELALTFPSLGEELSGVKPFNAEELDTWASSSSNACEQQKMTVRFLLALMHPAGDWKVGPFDLSDAFSFWDDEHRDAFCAWAERPFFPYEYLTCLLRNPVRAGNAESDGAEADKENGATEDAKVLAGRCGAK